MKNLIPAALAILVFGLGMASASGAFTSLHVFGDSLSCTAGSPAPAPAQYYYGKRYSNGRVWVEVLAQMQGLPFDPTNGNPHSFFGNTSSNLLAQISAYTPPADASNALVVIWVNNADLYYPALYYYSPTAWTAVINQSQTNHYKSITNLYARGIRTLVMPNVVDISTIPQFNDSTLYDTNYLHLQCLAYNVAFSNTLNKAANDCSGIKIYWPDYFTLLANMIASPAGFGLINPQPYGKSIDAIDAFNYGLPHANTNGYGTNYIFWDPTDPTAKVHYIMASVAQQMISPAQIGKLATFTGSNRLDLVNVPVYTNVLLNGLILSRTNLTLGNWTTNLAFSTTNLSQSVWVTNAAPQVFYRLKFPYVWAWP